MFYVIFLSRLIGFVFEALQVKFGTCLPQSKAGQPKGGWPGWVFSQFG
jgi:hypothetical protein